MNLVVNLMFVTPWAQPPRLQKPSHVWWSFTMKPRRRSLTKITSFHLLLPWTFKVRVKSRRQMATFLTTRAFGLEKSNGTKWGGCARSIPILFVPYQIHTLIWKQRSSCRTHSAYLQEHSITISTTALMHCTITIFSPCPPHRHFLYYIYYSTLNTNSRKLSKISNDSSYLSKPSDSLALFVM